MGWRDNFNQALRELLGGSKKNNSDITESKTAAAAKTLIMSSVYQVVSKYLKTAFPIYQNTMTRY
jgi:hypothetical protein